MDTLPTSLLRSMRIPRVLLRRAGNLAAVRESSRSRVRGAAVVPGAIERHFDDTVEGAIWFWQPAGLRTRMNGDGQAQSIG
ncbi:MAG: hypothetical protein OXL68_16400 [Paracoccaceae bacterium]|nr:hypothetical protein [Paracoccaceae bacterium]